MEKNVDRITWIRVMIIVAVIGCMGALGAALIGVLPDFSNQFSTCPYQGGTDNQTFVNLIRAEEEAVLTENIDIIKRIYSKNATVRDASTNETSDPMTHYEGLFDAIDFIQLSHYDFETVKNTGNKAWVKASDSSVMIFADTNEKQEFTSEPGAAHFIFEKNASGCWLISQFTKLAAHEAFP